MAQVVRQSLISIKIKAERKGKQFDEAAFAPTKAKIQEDNEAVSSAWYASGHLWNEGIIDPRETRNYLGFCLAIFNNKPIQGTQPYGVFRM